MRLFKKKLNSLLNMVKYDKPLKLFIKHTAWKIMSRKFWFSLSLLRNYLCGIMEQLRVFSCPFKDFSVKTRKLWSFLKYCQVCLWFWVNIYLWNLEQSARPFLQISYLYQMIVSVINDAMFRNIYFLATKLWYLFYWTKVGL